MKYRPLAIFIVSIVTLLEEIPNVSLMIFDEGSLIMRQEMISPFDSIDALSFVGLGEILQKKV
jgi:hypothetical protein